MTAAQRNLGQRTLGWMALVVVAAGLGVQAIRPSLGVPKGPQVEMAVPAPVKEILVRRCYACHSDEPRLAWWDHVVPVYWVVSSDVQRARAAVNFSELGTKPAAAQKAELYEAVNQVQLGAMPLRLYLLAHPHAGVTAEELATLKAYLDPFKPGSGASATAAGEAPKHLAEPASLSPKGPASASLNGVPFLPGYADWKVVSTTDRGDNHTLRIITGNELAVRAIEKHQLPSWPEGAAFAKITWQAVDDGHGHVVPGKFVQVEFMEKHRVQYAGTGGWGYARFRGEDLKPYGDGTHFDNECMGCHEPVRENDYVYSLPLPRGSR
jgi:hypothetical protein